MKRAEQSDARYAEIDEIKRDTIKVNMSDATNKASGCPVISDGQTMFVENEDSRTLIVSDSGSGKTRRLVLPTLVSMAKCSENVVVHDPKGELFRYTSKLFEKNGYKVVVFNYRDPFRGEMWNPLSLPAVLYKSGRKDEAIEMCMNFSISLYQPMEDADDPFWTCMSEQYFTGLFMLACELFSEEKITLKNLFELHLQAKRKVTSSGKTAMQVFFDDESEGKESNKVKYADIWKLLEGTVEAPTETKASILAVFSQALVRLILNDSICDMLSASNFNIESICERKTIIYLCTRDETRVYDPIVSGMIHQFYTTLIEIADKKYNSVLPIRTNFVLEELGCMAKIFEFNSKISASRSRNIRMYLVVQSLQQLALIYGKAESQVILGNTDVQYYFHSSDIELLDYFSSKAGIATTKYTKEKRPLLSRDDLLHLDKKKGQVLVFVKRQYPFITELPDISQYEIEYLGVPIELKKRDRTHINMIDFYGCAKEIIEKEQQRMDEIISNEQLDKRISELEEELLIEDVPEEESSVEIQLLENKIDRLIEKICLLEEET